LVEKLEALDGGRQSATTGHSDSEKCPELNGG